MISDAILNALLARRGWAARTQNGTRNMLRRKSRRPFIPDTLPLTVTRLLSLYQMFTRHRQHSRPIRPRESPREFPAREFALRAISRVSSESIGENIGKRDVYRSFRPPPCLLHFPTFPFVSRAMARLGGLSISRSRVLIALRNGGRCAVMSTF